MHKRVTAVYIAIFAFLLFSVSIVLAEDPKTFNPVKGYEFLASKNTNGQYENVITTAVAALAFKNAGATAHATQALTWLKAQKDEKNCWPKGNCKVKDTAFALWTLNEFGENTEGGKTWLKEALVPALKNNWYLEIVTTNNGTCKISYPGETGREEETIQVDAGAFPSCTITQPNTFFDLNKCLKKKDLVATKSSIDFDVNCADLGPAAIISIIYNTQNSYTLVQQATADRYQVIINNGCFSESLTDKTCSKDASLYTNWILSQLAAPASVDIWLKTVYDSLRPLDNALFLLAAKENKPNLVASLGKAQRNDGSFNNEVVETAMAMLALKKAGSTKELAAATEWLKTRQQTDGSWGGLYNTAIVLYTAFSNVPVTLPPPGGGPILPPKEQRCGDGLCAGDETFATCPKDCQTPSSICNENSICDVSKGEDSDNCGADCRCGDNLCDEYERTTGSCRSDCSKGPSSTAVCGNDRVEATEECDGADDAACPGLCTLSCACEEEEKGGFGKWLIIIILLLLGGAIAFYIRGKTKANKPLQKQSQEYKPFTTQLEKSQSQPRFPSYPQQSTSQQKLKIEDDLDKSLEEAKKLLKKL